MLVPFVEEAVATSLLCSITEQIIIVHESWSTAAVLQEQSAIQHAHPDCPSQGAVGSQPASGSSLSLAFWTINS